MLKKENINNHVFLTFWIFITVRLIIIFCTDHSMQGDATSRLNYIYEMTTKFNHWPADTWLPFPFWYVYSGVFFVDEWIYWPRIFNVFSIATCCFPIFQVARAYFSEKVAIIGLYLFTISIPQALMDTLILSDSIYLTLQIYCIYFIWKFVETNRMSYALKFSVFNSALLLTRYESLVFNLFILLYLIFKFRPQFKYFLILYFLPSLALFYMFLMNIKFGGHPLWAISMSDAICNKSHEIFGFDSLPLINNVMRAFPMSFLTLVLGIFGICVSCKNQIKLRKIPYIEIYIVFITLLLFYKLLSRTLIQDYRYFLVSAISLTFFGIYFIDKFFTKFSTKKFAFFTLISIYLLFQSYNIRILSQMFPLKFHEGLKATATWISLTLKDNDRVLIDRERDGTYKWHTESWGVLSGLRWERGYHCITRDLAHDPRNGGYDPSQTEQCLVEKNINKIVVFKNGFIDNLLKTNHPIFKNFNRTPEFSKDGYYVLNKKQN